VHPVSGFQVSSVQLIFVVIFASPGVDGGIL
jgi:hypothetical protein